MTLSPAWTVSCDQPPRPSWLAPPSSNDHSLCTPLASATMTRSQPCGLISSNSLTFPAIVCVLLRSNMAKEWWAPAVVAQHSSDHGKQLMIEKCFMGSLPGAVDGGVHLPATTLRC